VLIRPADRILQPSRHAGISKEVLIGRGILPNITQVAVSVLETGQATELHSHPTMYEIYFVLEGEATYFIDDREYEVASGDLLIVSPGALHRQTVTRGPHRIMYWGLETESQP
jgi:quercetin dioxygenase-like cupin family protein